MRVARVAYRRHAARRRGRHSRRFLRRSKLARLEAHRQFFRPPDAIRVAAIARHRARAGRSSGTADYSLITIASRYIQDTIEFSANESARVRVDAAPIVARAIKLGNEVGERFFVYIRAICAAK